MKTNKYLLISQSFQYYINNLESLECDKEDYLGCVARERIEEILTYQRYGFSVIYLSNDNTAIDFTDTLVIIRCHVGELKRIFETYPSILKSKYYFNYKELANNLYYWAKYIQPKYRNVYLVKYKEIYNCTFKPADNPNILNEPIFIKTIHKRVGLSSFVGENKRDALGLSGEAISDFIDCYVSKRINIIREYRCFIVNKKISSVSPYQDYMELIDQEKYNSDKEIIISKFNNNYFNIPFDKFPKIFVMDVLFDDQNKLDIVEFNEFSASGRYVMNDIKEFIGNAL